MRLLVSGEPIELAETGRLNDLINGSQLYDLVARMETSSLLALIEALGTDNTMQVWPEEAEQFEVLLAECVWMRHIPICDRHWKATEYDDISHRWWCETCVDEAVAYSEAVRCGDL